MPLFPAYLSLAEEDKIHQFICEIYRPDDLLTPYYTLRNEGGVKAAKFSSSPSSKGLDATTTDLKLILNSSIANRLVVSRQFIGWKAKVIVESFNSDTTARLDLFSGIVTSASISGINTKIEIGSPALLLKGKPPVVLSNNCPLIYGGSRCGQNKQPIWFTVTSNQSNVLTVGSPLALMPSTSTLYAVSIGDQDYRVVSFASNNPGFISSITLETAPIGHPDTACLVRTCDQTIQQCRKYNNSVRYSGSVLPRSPLSTR